ncbi:hypothetical protein C4D60_Mb06t16400 [Musa balbisiana]|uniref:WRKY domain-containing protein n=1 Tax=Musa balbisiana TaxID=52838 RepID=A0A4S8ING7_MUSBA|nr:hypothetical protein C4D60_Mb06t16400 [Musa balbisiana]
MSSSPTKVMASSVDDRPAVQSLIRIRETAAHLGVMLRPLFLEHAAAKSTFDELMDSVSRALTLAVVEETAAVADTGEDQLREISGGKSKISSVGERRRLCRRRSRPYSWTKVISPSLDDGHTWRKYGQKVIQSAKYPRSYFRCTHKHDQGCMAVRQVQKSQDDPSTYIVTYLGEHTCKSPSMAPQVIISAMDSRDSSHLISFGADSEKITREAPHPSLKKECDEEVLSNLTTVSSSPAATSNPAVAASVAPLAGHDHGDVTSGFQAPTSSVDMEFMEGLLELESLLGVDADCFFL